MRFQENMLKTLELTTNKKTVTIGTRLLNRRLEDFTAVPPGEPLDTCVDI